MSKEKSVIIILIIIILLLLGNPGTASENKTQAPFLEISYPEKGQKIFQPTTIKFKAAGFGLEQPTLLIHATDPFDETNQRFEPECTLVFNAEAGWGEMSCSHVWTVEQQRPFLEREVKIVALVGSSSGALSDDLLVFVSGERAWVFQKKRKEK